MLSKWNMMKIGLWWGFIGFVLICLIILHAQKNWHSNGMFTKMKAENSYFNIIILCQWKVLPYSKYPIIITLIRKKRRLKCVLLHLQYDVFVIGFFFLITFSSPMIYQYIPGDQCEQSWCKIVLDSYEKCRRSKWSNS